MNDLSEHRARGLLEQAAKSSQHFGYSLAEITTLIIKADALDWLEEHSLVVRGQSMHGGKNFNYDGDIDRRTLLSAITAAQKN